ncbi:MAG: Hint domain-containing protein [Pseudomonadota bacterium]
MPFLYIYSPDDFVEGLPAESGAKAAGSGTFSLTLKPGATPTLVEITDNDNIFDEVDGTQSITNDVTIDGEDYSANTTVNTAYDLINTGTGHKVTSLHFGGNGYQQGAVDGLVSTVEFEPGQTYTFNTERTSHRQDNDYDDYYACFASGTLIETQTGGKPVETLRVGDLVRCESGFQPLQMALSRRLSADELAARPKLRPIRIEAGALGSGLPRRDLRVSPQHRMLVRSAIVARVSAVPEALLAAKKLLLMPGISVDEGAREVTYHHLVFADHEVIYAEGAPTESFYPGPGALAALAPEAQAEFSALFPEAVAAAPPAAARHIPAGRDQKAIARRHAKNRKPLLSGG